MKRNKIILAFLSTPLLLVGCTNNENASNPISGNNSTTVNPTTSGESSTHVDKDYLLNIDYPKMGEVVSINHDDLTKFIQNYTYASSQEYATGEEHNQMKGLDLRWTPKENAQYYLVEFSTNPSLSTSQSYVTNETSIHLDDLYPNKTYFWRISAYYSNKIIRSDIYNFSTMVAPKVMNIDNLSNVRDLGGYPTFDGKRVKNNLVFRGMNPDSLTTIAKEQITELGIKTELDLRNAGEGKSGQNPMGVANYVLADNNGGLYYDNAPNGISTKTGQQVLAKEIKLFANRDNYPIYFHCAIGRDRTGSLALVLLSLLGVEKINVCIDYETSMFSRIATQDFKTTATSQILLNALFRIYNYIYSSYQGKNYQERVEKFLLDIGVTNEEINNIKDIMLEE